MGRPKEVETMTYREQPGEKCLHFDLTQLCVLPGFFCKHFPDTDIDVS